MRPVSVCRSPQHNPATACSTARSWVRRWAKALLQPSERARKVRRRGEAIASRLPFGDTFSRTIRTRSVDHTEDIASDTAEPILSSDTFGERGDEGFAIHAHPEAPMDAFNQGADVHRLRRLKYVEGHVNLRPTSWLPRLTLAGGARLIPSKSANSSQLSFERRFGRFEHRIPYLPHLLVHDAPPEKEDTHRHVGMSILVSKHTY